MSVWTVVINRARISWLRVRLANSYSRARLHGNGGSPIRGTTSLRLLCPSYPPNGHHQILGIVDDISGKFTFVSTGRTDFDQGNELTERWETRFRNFGSCVKTACGHWDKGSCRLGRAVTDLNLASSVDADDCPIKQECRWRAEQGDKVCRSCPSVRYVNFKKFDDN